MSTDIYHITHIRNLASILQGGGLMANSRLHRQKIPYQNIAHEQIQDRRAMIQVPCSMGGSLHNYVPFYFAPRSPMLYTIHRGNVANCPEGQKPILHIVSTIEGIDETSLDFAFTDGHAIMGYSDFYEDLDALEQVIDWELMNSRYWFDTPEDPNRRCRRQAEFLVYNFLPWGLVTEIGVVNTEIQSQVKQILQDMNLTTSVWVRSNWYY